MYKIIVVVAVIEASIIIAMIIALNKVINVCLN